MSDSGSSSFVRDEVNCLEEDGSNVMHNPFQETSLESIAESLYVPSGTVRFEKQCECPTAALAVLRTCWNAPNRGRRVLICGKEKGGCGYKCWVDPPIVGRGKYVIDFMWAVLENIWNDKMVNEVGSSNSPPRTLGERLANMDNYVYNRQIEPTLDVSKLPQYTLTYTEVLQLLRDWA